jgi:hypothetical protein
LQERNATLVDGSFAGVSTDILVTTPSEPSLPERYVVYSVTVWCCKNNIAFTVVME